MTSRYWGLAAAGVLALPVAALTALLPGAAARAAVTCGDNQATITFGDGTSTCQSDGAQVYPPGIITRICAGSRTEVAVAPGLGGSRIISPRDCSDYGPHVVPIPATVTVLPI
jgi:hypothetical protein